MKIAFTAKGSGWDAMIDPRFGRTDYVLIYDEEKDELVAHDNRSIESMAHGAGPKTAQMVHDLGPQVVITGNGPGGNAGSVLAQTGIKVFAGAGGMTISQAYEAYQNNQLKQGV